MPGSRVGRVVAAQGFGSAQTIIKKTGRTECERSVIFQTIVPVLLNKVVKWGVGALQVMNAVTGAHSSGQDKDRKPWADRGTTARVATLPSAPVFVGD